jgi:hypothetical protein
MIMKWREYVTLCCVRKKPFLLVVPHLMLTTNLVASLKPPLVHVHVLKDYYKCVNYFTENFN